MGGGHRYEAKVVCAQVVKLSVQLEDCVSPENEERLLVWVELGAAGFTRAQVHERDIEMDCTLIDADQ
jgi:hypothetical protein